MFSHIRQALKRGRQRLQVRTQCGISAVFLNEGADILGEQLVKPSLATDDFTTHQVKRLDAVGALVDLGDANIPDQLFLPPFTHVTVTTKHLLPDHTGIQPAICQERFGNRCQQRHHAFSMLTAGIVIGIFGNIQPLCNIG